ncbi:tetratricopeptide repeat protein [Marinicella sediminis]|uniref:Tetratricopeptide repeat protein n=1 Tax=Marinicella sediminis TaxID=1792834 RepID=A0ABV7J3U2_9GAMM|nr:tetratricopeptide repeat protein [Marinicella sediminis]
MLLLIFLTAALSSLNESEAERLIRQGQAMLEAENYPEALKITATMIAANDRIAEVHVIRADILNRLDRNTEAIEAYTTGLKLDPTFKHAYHNRAMVYWRLLQHQLAIEDFEQAIKVDPENQHSINNQSIYNNIGLVYQEMGSKKAASDAYWMATVVDKSYAEAWYNRGYVAELQYDYASAKWNYEQAVEAEPDNEIYQLALLRADFGLNRD